MKVIILLALFAFVGMAYSTQFCNDGVTLRSYWYRSNWWPPADCVCGKVSFQTQWYGCNGARNNCQTAMCPAQTGGDYFYRTVWWPGCSCGRVEWESAFTSKSACENSMCD